MPDESQHPDRGWLLEPLAPDEVRIHVDVGEGAEISPELRDALDTLVHELHAVEVEGFVNPPACPSLSSCDFYECAPFGRCTVLSRKPCAWDENCTVTKFGTF